MKLNVSIKGADKVMKEFIKRGTNAPGNVDKVAESYTRKMANSSGDMAPVKSGDLEEDIIASPRRLKLGVWEFGSTLAYAKRQEYEHRSKKGFIRKSVWNHRESLRKRIREELSK